MAPHFQLPLNFVATQAVWALEQGKPTLFQPTAMPGLRDKLQLDHSPASLTRIQQWLNRQRHLRSQARQALFDAERDNDTLLVLTFYVASFIGRNHGGMPVWESLEPSHPLHQLLGATSVVNVPDDPKGSVSNFNLMGVMRAAWERDGTDLLSMIAMHLDMQVLSHPEQALPDVPAHHNRAPLARYLALPMPDRAQVINEVPQRDVPEVMRLYFLQQHEMMAKGHCSCGAVVHANPALWEPHYIGLSLIDVVYDPLNRLHLNDLQAVASTLQTLRSMPDGDEDLPSSELAELRHALRAEHTHKVGVDLPLALYGYPLKISTLWVEQAQLPDGMLSPLGVPLILAPEVTPHIKLLPHILWSDDFRERWLQANEQRTGQRHSIDTLLAAYRVQHRQDMARLQAAHITTPASPVSMPELHNTLKATAETPASTTPPRDAKAPEGPLRQDDDPTAGAGLSRNCVLIGLAVLGLCLLLIIAL